MTFWSRNLNRLQRALSPTGLIGDEVGVYEAITEDGRMPFDPLLITVTTYCKMNEKEVKALKLSIEMPVAIGAKTYSGLQAIFKLTKQMTPPHSKVFDMVNDMVCATKYIIAFDTELDVWGSLKLQDNVMEKLQKDAETSAKSFNYISYPLSFYHNLLSRQIAACEIMLQGKSLAGDKDSTANLAVFGILAFLYFRTDHKFDPYLEDKPNILNTVVHYVAKYWPGFFPTKKTVVDPKNTDISSSDEN